MTTQPDLRMFDKLKALRNRMRIHNPEGDDAMTMDWAIRVIERAAECRRDLEELAEIINGKR